MQTFEELSPVLEAVAGQFAPSSAEYNAIRTAAYAIFYIQVNRLRPSFEDFMRECKKDLPGAGKR